MSDEKRVDIDFRFDPWGRLVSVSVPVSRIREALAITPPSPAPKVESAEHPSEPSIETLKAQVEYWRNAATERDEADEKPIVQRDRIPGQLAKTENLHLVGSPPAPFGTLAEMQRFADEPNYRGDGFVSVPRDYLKRWFTDVRAHIAAQPARTVPLTADLEALLKAVSVLPRRLQGDTWERALIQVRDWGLAWADSDAGRDFAKNGGSDA